MRKHILLLIPILLGVFMALLDLSIVSVALPAIQGQLGGGTAGVEWVIDSYTLMLSSFVLTGGSLADRYGRKRLFLTGIAVFTIGSVCCALAPSLATLIAGRAVQGIGATVLIPGTLSIITQAFREPAQRARVIGLWSTFGGGLAFLIGPVVGGILVSSFGWASIFWINLPLGIVTLFLGARAIPESADPENTALDPAGQVLGIAWLAALSYALIEGRQIGWGHPVIVSLLIFAAGTLLAFVLVENRRERPMLPVRLFTEKAFAVANSASFVLGFGSYAIYLFIPTFLQAAQGYSPAEAGLRLLPFSASLAVIPTLAGRWAGRSGPRAPMSAGYTLTGVSLVGMIFLGPDSPYPLSIALFTLIGGGIALSTAPTSTAALAAAPQNRSGIASGTVNAARQTGQTLGVAVLGSLISGIATDQLAARLHLAGGDGRPSTAADIVAHNGAPDSAGSGGVHGDMVHALFSDAYTAGLHTSVCVAGVITLAVAILIVLSDHRPAWLPRFRTRQPVSDVRTTTTDTPDLESATHSENSTEGTAWSQQ